MTDQNEVTVQEMAQARKELSDVEIEVKEAWDKRVAVVEKLPEEIASNEALEKAIEIESRVKALEAKFKAQLVAEYKGSGEEKKKQFDGGSVAIGKKFFYDESLIIPWLREHKHPELITEGIKKDEVKSLAKAINVAGVTTKETITPKINTDLSEFLPQEASND